jgi:hypothetical protein
MVETSVHVSVTVSRPAEDVYSFVSQPQNLPLWAAGLSGAIRYEDGQWLSESPMGTVAVEFVETNAFGVADHTVVLPDGERVFNPMRVLAAGDGSEVVFTLRRRPGMSEADFDADRDAVQRDLAALRALLDPPK